MTPDDGRHYTPPPMPEFWTLQVAAIVPGVTGKLRAALREARILFWESPEGIITAQVRADLVEKLCIHVERWLDSDDLDACHGSLTQGEFEEGAGESVKAEPLRRILARRWGGELLEMIEEDRLRVRFQPIVILAEPRRVGGYEVLLRGVAKGDDLVFPDRLLDAALEADLLLELDLAARRTALRHAAERIPQGAIFLNCRRESIATGDGFLDSLKTMVQERELERSRIVIEISRGGPNVSRGEMIATLRRCREEGFALAIDDFSEEPAYFELLHELKPQYVKFERRLVHSVDKDPFRQQALEAIVSECRELDVATIALGVETRAEWEWLKLRGVDLGQGYLFGVPAEIPAGTASIHLPGPSPRP